MDDAATPGMVERVDHLTAAVADMAFKLETLISSTTAFRESFGERMTDYADLVAHWSMEAETNLADQRRMTENLSAAVAKVERRVLEAIEGAATDLNQADALAAVLAEVTAARRELPDALAAVIPPPPPPPPAPELPEIPPVDLAPVAELAAELRRLRDELPDIVATVSPTADLTPLADEVRGLRRDLARLPAERDELSAVLAEITAVRRELPEVVAALPMPEPPELPAPVDIEPLAAEVRQLREALLAEAGAAEEDDVTLTEAVGDHLAALRAEMKVLQDRVAERPPVPPEVAALTAELQALRREMEAEPPLPEPVEPQATDSVHEVLAELVYEVKALRRRFPVKAPGVDDPPAVPPKRGARRT